MGSAILLEGLAFGEALRWRDGRLWFSDVLAWQSHSVRADGTDHVVVPVGCLPCGLGWDRDGGLLVVGMDDPRVHRLRAGGLGPFAHLPGHVHTRPQRHGGGD